MAKLPTAWCVGWSTLTQILPITLNYLGLPRYSHDTADYAKAEQAQLKIRPYIQYFHSSRYITDLANGDFCAVIGFNGYFFCEQPVTPRRRTTGWK
ncbi:Putrescine-binding periplasmic protein precursor [compost metagenome]